MQEFWEKLALKPSNIHVTGSIYRQIVGIPWYVRCTYNAIRSIGDCESSMPSEYSIWLNAVTAVEWQMTERGCLVLRVHINPILFIEWCDQRKRERNLRTRDIYARWLLTQMVQKVFLSSV